MKLYSSTIWKSLKWKSLVDAVHFSFIFPLSSARSQCDKEDWINRSHNDIAHLVKIDDKFCFSSNAHKICSSKPHDIPICIDIPLFEKQNDGMYISKYSVVL